MIGHPATVRRDGDGSRQWVKTHLILRLNHLPQFPLAGIQVNLIDRKSGESGDLGEDMFRVRCPAYGELTALNAGNRPVAACGD